jgi:hypothetical protein
MDQRLIFGLGMSAISLFGRWLFPTVPKPIGWAGFAAGLSLVGLSFFPSINAGPAVLGIAGIAALAGAISWQFNHHSIGPEAERKSANSGSKGTPADASNGQAKTAIRTEQLSPRQPPIGRTFSVDTDAPYAKPAFTVAVAEPKAVNAQVFWSIVGCAFPEGIPSGRTALTGEPTKALRQRIKTYSASLHAHETVYKTQLNKIAAELNGEDLTKRQAAMDTAKRDSITEYQEKLKPQADILVKEMHIRLQRSYPTSIADGLSVGAFGAICGGLYYGETPLSDLAHYLSRLGDELPD